MHFTYNNIYFPLAVVEMRKDYDLDVPSDICAACIQNKRNIMNDFNNRTLCADQECDIFRCPLVMRTISGTLPPLPNDPSVINVPINGLRETYIQVYGRLPYVVCEFKPAVNITNYINPSSFAVMCDRLRAAGVRALVGAKLIYKYPADSAAAGSKFMAKLYFGTWERYSKYAIRKALEETSVALLLKVLHSSITLHGHWLTCNEATAYGELDIKTPSSRSITTLKCDKFKIIQVYYKDVYFQTGIEFNCTE